MERPEFIPSGSPPHHARRGMEPCSPVNPFFLEGGFSADFVGGPGGRPHLPEWHSSSVPPGAFSLGPLQRPVLFSAAKPPRPIWAAPQVRRSTQGAPVWGDRSLSNKRGPRCAVRSGEQKRMGGCEAPLLEGVTSAPSGRIEKLGRALRGTPVPRRGISHPAARGRTPRPRPRRESPVPPQGSPLPKEKIQKGG